MISFSELGLKPWELIRISEKEYVLMLIGYLRKQNKELRHLRKLCWTIVCGYADPAQLPGHEFLYWKIAGDPLVRKRNTQEIKAIADKFKNTKWQVKRNSP